MPVGGWWLWLLRRSGRLDLHSAQLRQRSEPCSGGPELSLWSPPHAPPPRQSIWIVELLGKEKGAICAYRSGPFDEPPVITDLLAELLVAATLARILR